ncbi:hypothetical protein F3Y22_tig00002840pilonHSYRG01377 [Hibiscus syriacus]|uniref:Integrase catalytic domain-containing protein n=1 Tax=Hibiscus syriacus TaxID=106335 RepID=A0A6A3CPN8_HIBSY|nr:hypothetical protein F3Y22_tig00002840pilonHSYRG01377 [Hibiscus syriacus]
MLWRLPAAIHEAQVFVFYLPCFIVLCFLIWYVFFLEFKFVFLLNMVDLMADPTRENGSHINSLMSYTTTRSSWFLGKQDKLLASWLLTTCKISSLRHTLHSKGSLACLFMNFSKSQRCCDLLNASGSVVTEQEHVSVILAGLTMEFESVIAIASKEEVSLDTLTEILLDCEARHKMFLGEGLSANVVQLKPNGELSVKDSTDNHSSQVRDQHGGGYRGRGRGRSYNSNRPQCQLFVSIVITLVLVTLVLQLELFENDQMIRVLISVNPLHGDIGMAMGRIRGMVYTGDNALHMGNGDGIKIAHDAQTRQVLLRRRLIDEGFYQLLPCAEACSNAQLNHVAVISDPMDLWHRRLGHASSDLVVSDVWGHAPVIIHMVFILCVIVDIASRYTWVYLLKRKSEALQIDGGGEYQSLKGWLQQNGVEHRISCPGTSEQNSRAERKYRHIVEMGLTMLAQSSLPLKCYSSSHKGYQCLDDDGRVIISRHVVFDKHVFPFQQRCNISANSSCSPGVTEGLLPIVTTSVSRPSGVNEGTTSHTVDSSFTDGLLLPVEQIVADSVDTNGTTPSYAVEYCLMRSRLLQTRQMLLCVLHHLGLLLKSGSNASNAHRLVVEACLRAPRAWFESLKGYLISKGLVCQDQMPPCSFEEPVCVEPTKYMLDLLQMSGFATAKELHTPMGTSDYGLRFLSSSRLSLVGFADVNWGADVDDRRSISGYCIYFGGNLASWSSRKQQVVARSTAEAEYRNVASAASESCGLCLCSKTCSALSWKTNLWCDNTSTVDQLAVASTRGSSIRVGGNVSICELHEECSSESKAEM